MKNLRRMLACGLLLSQLFCGQAWAAEVHTPCYRNSVDTENSDFDKGDWKYKFTADSGQEAVLTGWRKAYISHHQWRPVCRAYHH